MPKQTFEEWMKQVNANIIRKVGMDYRDLPDIPYRDLYEAGKSPPIAANKAIRNAGSEW